MPAALQHISTCGHSPALQRQSPPKAAKQCRTPRSFLPALQNQTFMFLTFLSQKTKEIVFYLSKDIKLSSVLPVSLLGIQNIIIAGCSATSLNRKGATQTFKQEALPHPCYSLQELLMRLIASQSPNSADFKLLPVSLLCCLLWVMLINRKKPLT